VSAAVAVKERPILFSGAMIKAILNGMKTQTRRVVKPQPTEKQAEPYNVFYWDWKGRQVMNSAHFARQCPYGKPGDRLWVRETFQIENTAEYGVWNADPPEGPTRTVYPGEPEEHVLIPRYRATAPDTLLEVVDHDGDDPNDGMRWRPSIFMPRWASRITLEITDVRVERLQDVSEAGAKAEGVGAAALHATGDGLESWEFWNGPEPAPERFSYRDAYRLMWETINAKRGFGWDVNPWVWAVTFRRVV
jgi:hypothetical protein